MKILLLGATGRTGKHILEEILKQGHDVSCLARNVDRIKHHPKVTTYEGTPANYDDLEKAFDQCECIITALNVSRTNDFPWASLRTPRTFLSDVAGNIVALAQEYDLERVVICSAWGVGETRDDMPWWFRSLIDNSNIGAAYQDHERQERIFIESGLPWTIVRPVGLINFTKNKNVRESFNNVPKPSLLIARKSVAQYMVDALNIDRLIGEKVVISGM